MKKSILHFVLTLMTLQTAYCQDVLVAKTIDSTHNSVVAILRIDSAGNILVGGSGVLINSQVILTAGHVNFSGGQSLPGGCKASGLVSFSNKALNTNDRVSFDWTKDVESYPDTANFIKSFSDTTGKLKPTMFIDIGLLFLDHPITGKQIAKLPQPNLLTKLPENVSFLGVGYGYDKLMDSTFRFSSIDGLRRKWKIDSALLLNDLWLYSNCDTVIRQQFMNICDSGAPLFLNNDIVVIRYQTFT